MRRFRLLPLTAALGAATLSALSPAAAGADAPPAVASFFQTAQIALVELSPKGGYVAQASMLPDGTQVLLVRDTADPSRYTAVTRVDPTSVRIAAIHWINENRVGYTLKNAALGAQTNFDEFAIDRDGKNLKHLINGNWLHRREAGTGSMIGSRMLTADYAFHSTLNDGSDDILVEKYTWNNIDIAPESSRLFRLDTRTLRIGSTFEGAQPKATGDWITDANGVPRVAQSRVKGHCIVSYRKPDATAWTEIDNGTCYEHQRFSPLFMDGLNTLYVRADYKGYTAPYRYDLTTMKMDAEPIIDSPGFDFLGEPEIDFTTKRLMGVHLETDAETTVWFNPVMKADQARIDAALPGNINTVHCASDCLGSPVLLIKSETDRRPADYVLYTRATGKLVGLGNIHPDIVPAQMGQRSFHRYAARDGRAIPAYVTLPVGKADGPRPAIVLVHGGPSARGASWGWDAEAAFLASRGYVVIQPEFRGSTGYGGAHFRAGWKQWGGAMQDDLADAAQWAVKQGWADPKRVGIMGASYGGYATLMGLIKDPHIFRAGVAWAAVTDIGLMFTSTQSDASEENLGYSMRTLIGDPDNPADAKMFRDNSPLPRAAELKQPLLMAHGLDDRRVPLEHARSFASAVKAGNSHFTAVYYDNEGHGWRNEKTRLDFWRQVETFLDENLKNRRAD